MNYYQYKRRAPRRSGADYIKPFIVIAIFVAIIVAGWNLLSSMLIGEEMPLSEEKVFLDIETGSAKAMTASDASWKNVPTSINLYKGEKVKTLSDGRVTLSFFDDNLVRLDKGSELEISELSQEAEKEIIDFGLAEGKAWVNIDSMRGGKTDFHLTTSMIRLKTSGGIMAVSYPGTVYVLSGSAEVDVLRQNDVIKSVRVGVGQQLQVDEGITVDLDEGLDKEILFALDDSFKTSNWYRWNRQKDGLESLDEDVSEDDGSMVEELDESDTAEVIDSADEEETVDEEAVVQEEEEEEDLSDDKTPPETPQFTDPGHNGDTIELEDIQQELSGTVSEDTYVVVVNDYRLTQYKPGSGKFSYKANVAYKNLKLGENEYKVTALDKAGNESEAGIITLSLSQEVYDEKMEDQEEADDNKTESSAPAAASSEGGVKFTAPNDGENLVTSETEFELKGTVPEGTVKVLVNDYKLSGFSEGDTTFVYRAKASFKNLIIGEVNTYTAKAYDKDDVLLGTATMTIDVESGSSSETGGAPIITMPTSSATYDTTLDQLVIGGSVGKWITRVRINGSNITEYIPGSEEWKITVNLESGANEFEICAEKEGVEQGCSTIVINYSN